MPPNVLKISSIIRGRHWIDPNEGSKILHLSKAALLEGRGIVLDFSDKDLVITAFLNAAIGPLYDGSLSKEQLSLLSFTNTSADDDSLIRRVIDNAIVYYSNKSQIDDAWGAEFDEE